MPYMGDKRTDDLIATVIEGKDYTRYIVISHLVLRALLVLLVRLLLHLILHLSVAIFIYGLLHLGHLLRHLV